MTVNLAACRPNFFLIGAAKSGTTSVANYLDQHPDIFVSNPKEPNFFAFEPNSTPSCEGPADSQHLFELLLKYSVTSPQAYQGLFAGTEGKRAVGEASVRYLYAAQSAKRIADYNPNAKLVVILRDPVDRLYSHYHMNVRLQIEPADLVDAIAAEDARYEQGWGWDWHYCRLGMYSHQLHRYYDNFDRSQILVLFYNHLVKDPIQTMQTIFEHLEVDSSFEPDLSERAMVGYTPRWRFLRMLIREDNFVKSIAKQFVPARTRTAVSSWSERKNRRSIPKLNSALRQVLKETFVEDSIHLDELLGRHIPR